MGCVFLLAGVATSVSAGDYHTCSILSNGSLMCWGSNSYGELGIWTNVTSISTPTAVDFDGGAGKE